MDVGQIVADMSWTTVLTILIGGYALGVAVFLILENRSPQSTFAWLFLLLIFPLGGLLLYHMFGRRRHAFSRERSPAKLLEGTTLADRASRVIAEQPAKLAALGDQHSEYARLARMLWATARSPLTLGNRLEILQDAREKYPRLLSDIQNASQSIHLLYYEWASDPFTADVGRLLSEKVEQGVHVRILYDPVGSFAMLTRRYVRELLANGIQMYPFAPLWQLHTLSYRNHRKVAVLDGRIGYSGGLNMTEKHLTGPRDFTGWRDTHARVSGEAVSILQSVFATMWHNTTGESLFDESSFPEVRHGSDGVSVQVVSAGPDSRWEARAGVRVFLYLGAYFHSKTVCVDSILCSIGSANMNIRSFSINYETNLVIYDERVTRELEADFNGDLEHCVPFSADDYDGRTRRARFVDSTLRLCSPLL